MAKITKPELEHLKDVCLCGHHNYIHMSDGRCYGSWHAPCECQEYRAISEALSKEVQIVPQRESRWPEGTE
jgi:hypothetical protein